MYDGKVSAIAKFQNLIWKAISVCPGKAFANFICTKLYPYLQKKHNHLKNPMSVEVQKTYFISVECAIGKLQIFLVFLEDQFWL